MSQELQLFGINHKSSSLSQRERFIIDASNQISIKEFLNEQFSISAPSFFGLSTCNRTEFYLYGEKGIIDEVFLQVKKILSADDIEESCFYFFSGPAALEHMINVCCGIDSQVVGEQEIFGQFKNAYETAKLQNLLDYPLMQFTERVIKISKEIRSSTNIGTNPLSVSGLSLNLIKDIFTSPQDERVLVVGGGEMAISILKNLHKKGLNSIKAINRTVKNLQISEDFSIVPMPLNLLQKQILESDIIICSSSTMTPIVGKGAIENALNSRNNKPLLIIDLGVPRNVEQEVSKLELVYLFTIDDIEQITQENLEERLIEAGRAKEIISRQVSIVFEEITEKTLKSNLIEELNILLAAAPKPNIEDLESTGDLNMGLLNFIEKNSKDHLKTNFKEGIHKLDANTLRSILKEIL